ncbi:membrane-bound lytic murein transglycosylase A [Salmonella enterica subsp. arizonae]|uniref:Membrane-bound lytic murein transglycosylase A n=1 Tax=Salmonella enterica subsp. arizonae TaxID=59203 RepID=A0A379STQ0_SALER|nr:membrane-bound lytic murein transglycosylase A [Salmonella enterica subsp. arizonae]
MPGKNGWPYRSIGKVLIDRGEVKKEDMSMQAIREWGEKHSEAEVRELLEQNPSFVFFKPQSFAPVKGASAVPLIGRTSVALTAALFRLARLCWRRCRCWTTTVNLAVSTSYV